MKKLAALLLITVLLYQAGGFALQFLNQSSEEISSEEIAQLDKVVVKLPISLPYSQNWEEPKKIEGSVQKGDDFYQMVEQKMEGDTLYTTMVANHSARESFLELAEMVDQHLQNDSPKHDHSKSSLINLLVKEYCDSKQTFVLYIMDWSSVDVNFSTPSYALSTYTPELFSPPKAC